jgi:hypothetical protein
MSQRAILAASAVLAAAVFLPLGLASARPDQAARAEIVWTPVPASGKKCPIDDHYYFRWEFNQKPKMGLVILKIQVFDKADDQVVPFKATGRSDMPSMRGAHDSGDVELKLNRKNDYLLPVNVVMPGDWEIRLTFWLDGRPIYHGSLRFDV